MDCAINFLANITNDFGQQFSFIIDQQNTAIKFTIFVKFCFYNQLKQQG